MPRLRFSIAGMLGVVVVIGVVLGALRNPSIVWTNAIATLTLGLLLTGVVGAWFLRGRGRAFWAGFALFGGVYLLLVNWDWVGGQMGHDLSGGLSELVDSVLPAPPVNTRTGAASSYLWQIRSDALGNLVQIGRFLLTLVFALVGGCIARAFAARTESRGDL